MTGPFDPFGILDLVDPSDCFENSEDDDAGNTEESEDFKNISDLVEDVILGIPSDSFFS